METNKLLLRTLLLRPFLVGVLLSYREIWPIYSMDLLGRIPLEAKEFLHVLHLR